MDQSRFQEAQQASDAGEYRTAAKGFLASASRGPDGNGAAYHMAGNSLMRLRRHQDAVTVYGHALRDQVYDRRGAVWANLGSAFCEIGEYAEAVKAYESALEEPDYMTPYKAHQGMAGALLERGRVEDAAVAYRKAALDPGNPDPGKALVNLGLCFMGLGRPADAVEAYRAALGFDDYKGRGKALANLGQAYMALGDFENAVRSFEKATGMHGHKLSASAEAAYATARAHVRPGVAAPEAEPSTPTAPAAAPVAAAAETALELDPGLAPLQLVEPEGPLAEPASSPIASAGPADVARAAPATTPVAAAKAVAREGLLAEELTDSWGVGQLGSTTMDWDFLGAPAEVATEPAAAQVPAPAEADLTQPLAPFDHAGPESVLGFGDEDAVADFFSATDEELKARDREARRVARHARGPWAIWRNVLIAVVVVMLLAGGLLGSYQLGYGWPTQSQTVGDLLSAFQTGSSIESYWVAAPTKDITKEMAKIPPVKSFTIDNVVQGATTSKVAVTVTPKTGAALHYTITLAREGVGWKVSGVDNDWSSTGG